MWELHLSVAVESHCVTRSILRHPWVHICDCPRHPLTVPLVFYTLTASSSLSLSFAKSLPLRSSVKAPAGPTAGTALLLTLHSCPITAPSNARAVTGL